MDYLYPIAFLCISENNYKIFRRSNYARCKEKEEIIGVCQAPTWINGNQLMLHLVPPSRLTEGMAWMGAMNSIGSSAGSAIAGQFIDRMGSHGGFMVVTTLALVSLAIALIGFKQIKGSTEQPTLTEVSV